MPEHFNSLPCPLQADKLVIGGKMASVFLSAKGVPMGDTDIEEAHRVGVQLLPLCFARSMPTHHACTWQ